MELEHISLQNKDGEPSCLDDEATNTLPLSSAEHEQLLEGPLVVPVESQFVVLRNLIRSSGIYALSSVALPLVSLALAPFLTSNLSSENYGILTVVNTAVGLGAGITQLGLSSAFFRAYGYDYSSQEDKRAVVATTTLLLCLVSIPCALLIFVMAPWLAQNLLGSASLSVLVSIASITVLAQNLAVPGMAWLRAENRPFFYSLLAISNLLITLGSNILLIGYLHWGLTGAVFANSSGYLCVALLTLPLILWRAGIKLRTDVARGLLTFGLPLVLNFFAYWVLQLSDRYLLKLFASYSETANYAVAYALGSAMTVVVMGPFTLAWPTALFAIAKREDAAEVFRLVFRWFGMLLLVAAFGLSLLGTILLDRLFPIAYHASAPIIPIVAGSVVFYGIYYIFMVGANVQRKTWLAAVFTSTAALSNVLLNLYLIPRYGAMGAALATLLAYIILALSAYCVNQRLYPIRFEIGRFLLAAGLGVALYGGSGLLASSMQPLAGWGLYGGALLFYAACLALIAKLPQEKKEAANE